jgi:hypothetical protein
MCAGAIRYTILSLALTIGMIILTLDSAPLDLIADANTSETDLQSISLDINLDPNL